MKVVRDISVTSALFGRQGPWGSAWASPISGTLPGLVLDFAAGAYGVDGTQSDLASLVSLTRLSDATLIDSGGLIETVADNIHRLTHDPVSLARLGLLLEPSRSNLLTDSGLPVGQTVSVTAEVHTLSFYGAGTITLSGAHAATIPGVGTFPARTSFGFTPGAGDLVLGFSGDVTEAQLETGNTASSYIPTTTAPETRADEIATVGLGPWFDGTGGTLVFSGHIDGAAANDRIIEIDNGSTSTRLSLLWNTVLQKPQFQVWSGGALQAAIAPAGNAIEFGTPFRLAIAFAADDFSIALNGGSLAKDSLGLMPSGLTPVRLGRSLWGAQGLMTTEAITYFPARLVDAEIQALSA